MVAAAVEKTGLARAIERFPASYIRYHKGMEALDAFYTPKRNWDTQVTIVYGVSGLGKSAYALQAPAPYKLPAAATAGGTEFFGQYQPRDHESVVADEFHGGSMRYSTFLQVADRYPMEVHTKGGFRQLLIHHLVVTSNLAPDEWYPNVFQDATAWSAFWRRIDNVILFTEGGWILIKVRFIETINRQTIYPAAPC